MREGERGREREGERKKKRESERELERVRVSEREREGGRERKKINTVTEPMLIFLPKLYLKLTIKIFTEAKSDRVKSSYSTF